MNGRKLWEGDLEVAGQLGTYRLWENERGELETQLLLVPGQAGGNWGERTMLGLTEAALLRTLVAQLPGAPGESAAQPPNTMLPADPALRAGVLADCLAAASRALGTAVTVMTEARRVCVAAVETSGKPSTRAFARRVAGILGTFRQRAAADLAATYVPVTGVNPLASAMQSEDGRVGERTESDGEEHEGRHAPGGREGEGGGADDHDDATGRGTRPDR